MGGGLGQWRLVEGGLDSSSWGGWGRSDLCKWEEGLVRVEWWRVDWTVAEGGGGWGER